MELQELEERLKHHRKLFAMLLVIAVMAGFFLFANFKINKNIKLEEAYNINITSNLENIAVIAKAVSVYDITASRKIYGKNDNTPLPIASLAKILTVAEGLRGHKMDDAIYVSPEAIKQYGDFGIFANEKWRIGDLAKFTLVVSANDGAYALSEQEKDFLNNLNLKAHRLGAGDASFVNPTGLDIEKNKDNETISAKNSPLQAGAVASAEDVNNMAIYAVQAYGDVYGATTLPEIKLKSLSGFEHTFKNTDVLVGKIPNLVFSKTGYTELAGGNLCIIFKDKRGHAIAVTVLGSTFDGRFADMEKIVNVLYSF